MSRGYDFNLGLAFYTLAEQHAAKVALAYPDGRTYSYQEINEFSNRIARFLLKNDISNGDVVAVFNNKSVQAYSLMIACLKIGAIYTNLDGTNPWERLKKIIGTCRPKTIFYDEANKALTQVPLAFEEINLVDLLSLAFQDNIKGLKSSDLDVSDSIHGGMPAYIMFTSGSTGFPKGAVMSHSNVLNFIKWGKQTFQITEADVFTNVNPIYFDNSVFDFYTSIFSGATLVPLDASIVKSPKNLVQTINRSKCTIWFSVPSLLVYLLTTKAITKEDFPSIRQIVFGGEGFPKNKLRQLFSLLGERVALFNVYGPTECTCICSSYKITVKDFENMSELAPLGYIAPNFGYEIIPVGEEASHYGELALIGPCVGLGYFNDLDLTEKSFIQNNRKKYQERMYMTGDLVEQAENGYLFFRGRVDNQIKHMGYRIELEEVEAAFCSLDYVNEVGVIYEKVTLELGQITAFVSISVENKDVSEIQRDIKAILPAYMIPKIQVIDSLPKNRNGKIDRKQLAAFV